MVSASIVLYKNKQQEIEKIVRTLVSCKVIKKIYLIDNSPNNSLRVLTDISPKLISYIHNKDNLGFGKAHNIAFKKALGEKYSFHAIVNPDVEFEPKIISVLTQKLEDDHEIGLIMPKILNKDGHTQLLPKLLPSPIDLFIRVLLPNSKIFRQRRKLYLLEDFLDMELNVPIISGCFCMVRLETIQKIGYYDDRFFMYFEDFDLSRRIHSKFKTIYCPSAVITHAHERGATKNLKLFKIFLQSAVSYFNKYGWFRDKTRKQINKDVISNLK